MPRYDPPGQQGHPRGLQEAHPQPQRAGGEVGARFQQLSGSPAFRKVAGIIDGCHVRIVPPGQFAADYFNPTLFHSVQFQAICDHKGCFLNVVVGFPSCVHDHLRCSSFYAHQLYPPPRWCLIGDGRYLCLAEPICPMTPFREPVWNAVEGRYNTTLSRAPCVVDRAFGVLKTRWHPIFLKALEVKVEFAFEVITACLFLQNPCLGNVDILEPKVVEEDDGDAGMTAKPMSPSSGRGRPSGTGLQLWCPLLVTGSQCCRNMVTVTCLFVFNPGSSMIVCICLHSESFVRLCYSTLLYIVVL